MSRLSLTALAVAVVAVSLAVASPSVAHAAKPCYQRVWDDWTKHGEITGHYSPKCLREAYNKVPEDLRDYSSIQDDIQAALLAHYGASGSGPNGSGTGSSQSFTPAQLKKRAELAVPHAGTPDSVPDTSRSLPLPLLILGGVVLAAALAAVSPALIQRLRTRFPRARPAPQTDR
jgi:hypothetical protein